MVDIAMCQNKNCPKKDTCYRFKATPDPEYQSYTCFTYESSCYGYWEIEEEV